MTLSKDIWANYLKRGRTIEVLPIALMRARTALRKEELSPFECIYGRPFLHTDIVIDPEVLELTSYVTQVSAFQQALTELLETTPDPASESSKPLFQPGTEVLKKTLGSGGQSLEPLWEGPYQLFFLLSQLSKCQELIRWCITLEFNRRHPDQN